MKPAKKKTTPAAAVKPTQKAKAATPKNAKAAVTRAAATKTAAQPVARAGGVKKKSVPAKPPAARTPSKPAAKPPAKPGAKAAPKKKATRTLAKKSEPKKVVKPAAAAPVKKTPATAKSKPAATGEKTKARATVRVPVARPASKQKPAATGKPARKLPKIPALLLEGDGPAVSARSGPGNRYDLGVAAPPVTPSGDDLVLPDSYGTRRLQLVARDPQWLYAHWDLTGEQLRTYNQLSRSGHLTLQVFEDDMAGKPRLEIDVHPESRSWFAHVGKGGGRYFAVLGFHDKLGDWHEIAVSPRAVTPPDSLSDDLEAVFTSIPVTMSFSELISVVRKYAAGEPKLARALQLLQEVDVPEFREFPIAAAPSAMPPRWTEAQQQALADAVTMDEVRRVWIGSEEVLELIKGRRGLSSESAIPVGGISSISSPFGGGEAKGERGFWFNVNAELIIYGATEPDASVTIGGRTIQLRSDGSFSYRFALPDGNYGLPIAATSADKVETRNADLKFARSTDYRGDVGTHPQDPKLKQPDPKNVS